MTPEGRQDLAAVIAKLKVELQIIDEYRDGDTEAVFGRYLHDSTPGDPRVSEAFAQLFFRTRDLLALLLAEAQRQDQETKEVTTRVEDSQYQKPLATASENEVGPTTLEQAARTVIETFERDEAQGYHSKDRRFAVTILKAALPAPAPHATLAASDLTPAQLACGYCLYGPPAICTCGTCAAKQGD